MIHCRWGYKVSSYSDFNVNSVLRPLVVKVNKAYLFTSRFIFIVNVDVDTNCMDKQQFLRFGSRQWFIKRSGGN